MHVRNMLVILGLALVLSPGIQAQEESPNYLAFMTDTQQVECAALVLPEATTPEQVQANEVAKQAFLARQAAIAAPTACSISEQPAPDFEPLLAAVKECGNCSNCFSAKACDGCAVGAVCSAPGANPTRACRIVQQCSNGKYCCGCS